VYGKGGGIMPNIKSAKKRVRIAAVKTARNKSTKSALKTAIKKANAAIDANAANKVELVNYAFKKIDQAVAKNILHKNNAARKKSALARKLNAAK
jgi:small subunit ribosomal protein S20